MLKDLRYAIRDLVKHPGFASVAVVTLALGIGANTAIFSVVNAVLLRPLPFPEANQLVMVWGNFLKLNMERLPAKAAEYEDYAAQNETFDSVAAYENQNFNLTRDDQPQRITAARITSNLLSLLQVQPVEGRAFTSDEGGPGRDNVAILSHGFRQRCFAVDKSVINQVVTLDDRSYTVIGVMPADFAFPYSEPADVFVPLSYSAEQIARRQGPYYLSVIARLKGGVTLALARSQMSALAQHFEREQRGYRGPNGEDGGWRITVVPLEEEIVGGNRRALLVLLAAVGLVLTVACANVSNLLLLRAAKRRRELAIRRALGASRWRIAQQLLVEGLLLTTVSAAIGLLVARWGVDLLTTIDSASLPRANEISIDGRVLAFTTLAAIISSLLLGLVPALQASRLDLQASLKAAGARGGSGRNYFSNVLVVSEVALSLMLLVGAGLLINSFLRLQRVDPGVVVNQLMTAEINLSSVRYREPVQASSFYRELSQRIESLPGVQGVSFSTLQPLSGATQKDPFAIEGRSLNPEQLTTAGWQVVGANYFRTLGIPIIKGRDIAAQDLDQASSVVAVINEKMAALYWPNEDPIGRRVTLGLPRPGNPWITIVGIAKDLPARLDRQPEPDWFLSRTADIQLNRYLFVRSVSDVSALTNSIRSAVLAIDRNQPVTAFQTMNEVLDKTIAPRKLNTLLLGIFAAIALGFAAVGVYSVISYSVTLRTQEIGIRMALGAQKVAILRLVLKSGMKATLIGTAMGLLGAFMLTRLMSSLLFEVSATDPLTYVVVSLFSIGVALLACYIPARRATSVDPLVALRYE